MIAVERLTCGQKYVWLVSYLKLVFIPWRSHLNILGHKNKKCTDQRGPRPALLGACWCFWCHVARFVVNTWALLTLYTCGSICGQQLCFLLCSPCTQVVNPLHLSYPPQLVGQQAEPGFSNISEQTHVSFQIARG